MSQETSLWLNQNTLIGMTDKRGSAWHYRAEDQGSESNHYPGAIPVDDVLRRLFHWHAVEGDVTSTVLLPDGVLTITDPTRKTIVRPDTQTILGIFRGQPGTDEGYMIHQYDEWLLEKVADLLDDDLGISSAGLLAQGGIAWVEVSVPDTIVTPEGVSFRPNLLASTSLDGSLSSTYARTINNTVCDNTMAANNYEAMASGKALKVRHSRYSRLKLAEVKQTLDLVHSTADDFAAQVAALTSQKVTPHQFGKFMDAILPVVDQDNEPLEGRSLTIATNKRESLLNLYIDDPRCAPWKDTAWGVVQAVNTAVHHEFSAKGNRAERNMLKMVKGDFEKLDADTLATLKTVLA